MRLFSIGVLAFLVGLFPLHALSNPRVAHAGKDSCKQCACCLEKLPTPLTSDKTSAVPAQVQTFLVWAIRWAGNAADFLHTPNRESNRSPSIVSQARAFSAPIYQLHCLYLL